MKNEENETGPNRSWFIRTKYFQYWGSSGGYWAVMIGKPDNPIPLIRPLRLFVADSTWDHFTHFGPAPIVLLDENGEVWRKGSGAITGRV